MRTSDFLIQETTTPLKSFLYNRLGDTNGFTVDLPDETYDYRENE